MFFQWEIVTTEPLQNRDPLLNRLKNVTFDHIGEDIESVPAPSRKIREMSNIVICFINYMFLRLAGWT